MPTVPPGPRELAQRLSPEAKSPDLVGAALSIAGLGLLIWSLIEAPARGWTSARVLAAGIGGLAVLAVFVWWERRSADPS